MRTLQVTRLGLVREPDPPRTQREKQLARRARVELLPAVSDVAREHDQAVVGVDEHGLMARRVPGGREYPHAGHDLGLAVVLDVGRTVELSPRRDGVVL